MTANTPKTRKEEEKEGRRPWNPYITIEHHKALKLRLKALAIRFKVTLTLQCRRLWPLIGEMIHVTSRWIREMIHALSKGKRAGVLNTRLSVPRITLHVRDITPTCYKNSKALILNVYRRALFNIIYVIRTCAAPRGGGESDGAICSYSKGVVYALPCRVMQESRVVYG